MMRTILVTGGAGFIGSNLVRHLLAGTDDRVVTLDKLTYAGNLTSLDECLENPRHRFEQVDLRDPEGLRRVMDTHDPDVVMHLAAESHVDRSIDGPGEFVETNVVGTYNLLQASLNHWSAMRGERRDGFRFLHVSTDEVYGSLGKEDPGFSETTPYDPHSPYSASKAASDHLARSWQDTYGLPVLVTNCSNNYGPNQFPEKLIPVVVLKGLREEPIPVYGKGENVRDWLFVGDHCRALRLVAERGVPGRTYNIGGNNELPNIELVRRLCGILDLLRPRASGDSYEDLIEFVTDRPGHDLRYAIDASRIRDELGWEPLETAESGFHKTVEWYLENREWWEAILDGSYANLDRQGLKACS